MVQRTQSGGEDKIMLFYSLLKQGVSALPEGSHSERPENIRAFSSARTSGGGICSAGLSVYQYVGAHCIAETVGASGIVVTESRGADPSPSARKLTSGQAKPVRVLKKAHANARPVRDDTWMRLPPQDTPSL